MLFQPSNIYPSTFSGIGAGTVDVTQGLTVSWQVNGDTPMTAYQIKIYQNDSDSTLMYDSGSLAVTPAFEPHDKYGNPTFFSTQISAAALSTAGIVNGYQYGYKMLITQYWGVSDHVDQTSASVFITRSTPSLAIDAISSPVTTSSVTITATYSQAQGDPISTVEWVFAQAGSESTPIKETGAVSTQILSFDVDGLITGNTYSVMCNVVTANGVEATTGWVQFSVSYPSSSIAIDYQLAQLKNSSATYLSWEGLGSNILAYPYTDSTKTTNGVTFTVNGEGDVVANGTASADAYFTIASGTLSQIGLTAGQKLVVSSNYSGANIEITETNNSNIVVSTISGGDPLQYIVPFTTNTLKFYIVIPKGVTVTSQLLQPMLNLNDRIVGVNDLSVQMSPIQSLNGYDAPWPAGGGKNLWPEYETQEVNSVTLTNDHGKVTINGTASTDTYFDINTSIAVAANESYYIAAFNPSASSSNRLSLFMITSSGNPQINLNTANASTTGSYASAFTITKLRIRVPSGVQYTDFVLYPYVQIGGTAPTSWTPYSNLCPISGRTGVELYRTGKNLFNPHLYAGIDYNPTLGATVTPTDAAQQFTDNGSGVFTLTTSSTWRQYSILIPLVEGNNYHVKFSCSSSAQMGITRGFLDANHKVLKKENSTDTSQSYNYNVVLPTGAAYFFMVITNRSTASATLTLTQPQFEIGSAATDYEPYQGNTYAVEWTTPAGTVYHGTVDPVAGQLTVDKSVYRFTGSESWTLSGTSFFYTFITEGLASASGYFDTENGVHLHYNTSNGQVRVYIDGQNPFLSTSSDMQDYFPSGIGFLYTLATPLTYQLTPQEIEVLVGMNNIWSTGDSVSVTYTKNTGTPATLSGAIVTITDSNAVVIPTPVYTPGITGVSIYRYSQGSPVLSKVYEISDDTSRILDYDAPSQEQLSYLIAAHSGVGDLFCQTNTFKPVFWFYSLLLCSQDSSGNYHVVKEYIFKYGVETGAMSNNNDPTLQKNFTPYPNRQPISSLYKTGKVSGYIGSVSSLKKYSDSVSLQNAIYEISTSNLTKFLKTRKGDVIMVDTASAIQMKTDDDTVEQALKATIDWVEVGDASTVSIVSIPTDSFWPL